MSGLNNILKWNPATIQAKAGKWAIVGLVALCLLLGAYFLGRHDGKQGCLGALKTVAAKVADTRAGNAVDSAARFGQYIKNDRALEVGITDLMAEIDAMYANQPKARPIEKTKLVEVPGEPELVYVPTDSCPSDFFDADELHLFNVGNKRSDFNASDSR